MRLLLLFAFAFQVLLACPVMASIKTSDGVSLAVTQTGPLTGPNLLFVPGWRQAAAEWRKQVEFFTAAGYRVTTYDMRGHGESDKPEFGYRVSRFAADLKDVITGLHLDKVTIVSHSMGCSVTWAFWDLFPEHRGLIKQLVSVDQGPHIVIDPTWPEGQATELASIFTPDAVYQTAADMANQGPALVKSMFTSNASAEDVAWVIEQNVKMSDANAAKLLIDHAFMDWRDVLPRITVPTFVIGGDVSIFAAAHVKYVADKIPGAKSYVFSAEEKGSHFLFWENAEKFNALVKDFISGSNTGAISGSVSASISIST